MEKIMIIDSDMHQMRLLSDVLSKEYHLLKCGRGSKAMELFHLYQPSALILDPIAAELNGRAFVRQIRSLPYRGHIPILAVTCITTMKHVEESFDWGVDVVFSKPFEGDRIAKKLRDYLDRSGSLVRREPAGTF